MGETADLIVLGESGDQVSILPCLNVQLRW